MYYIMHFEVISILCTVKFRKLLTAYKVFGCLPHTLFRTNKSTTIIKPMSFVKLEVLGQ